MSIRSAFLVLTAALAFASRSDARSVAIVLTGDVPPAAAHGLAKLKESLRKKGFEVPDSAVNTADFFVLAGVGSTASVPVPAGPESLAVRHGRHLGKPAIILRGSDARGLMYAALDTAERVGGSAAGDDPFARVRDIAEQPYLVGRGISIYTMQRAYFETRLYDEKYWARYFDLLASSRINNFVVIFGYENGGFMAPA
jgi:hypothetical protein